MQAMETFVYTLFKLYFHTRLPKALEKKMGGHLALLTGFSLPLIHSCFSANTEDRTLVSFFIGFYDHPFFDHAIFVIIAGHNTFVLKIVKSMQEKKLPK